jgi:hypothetical protein
LLRTSKSHFHFDIAHRNYTPFTTKTLIANTTDDNGIRLAIYSYYEKMVIPLFFALPFNSGTLIRRLDTPTDEPYSMSQVRAKADNNSLLRNVRSMCKTLYKVLIAPELADDFYRQPDGHEFDQSSALDAAAGDDLTKKIEVDAL